MYLPISDEAPNVPHFVFVWAAELDSPATCGWLGVPSLGDQPFAAVHQLWADPEGDVSVPARHSAPTGPNFDDRASDALALRLKPRPDREAGA